MTITVSNTQKIVTLNGVPARVWVGKTDSGVGVHLYVTRVAVLQTADTEQFERELQAVAPPSPEVQAIPLRMIL